MADLRHILCPIDLSEPSTRALQRAFGIARWYGADLTVLHVLPPHAAGAVASRPGRGGGVATAVGTSVMELVWLDVRRLVDARAVPDVQAHVVVEEAADVAQEVVNRAFQHHAGMIVMGAHAGSRHETLRLRSVADRVLTTARCPVLTVPGLQSGPPPCSPIPFRRILCALDFSLSAAAVLDWALWLACGATSRLTLLHVLDTTARSPELARRGAEDFASRRAAATARLREMVPDAARAACPIEEVVWAGDRCREILRTAEQRGSDLIVMGLQVRGAGDVFRFGSTTHHVVRAAQCPVLTVPSQ